MIILDCMKPITHKRLIEHELEGFGIRLNKTPPDLIFKKKEEGGINFATTETDGQLDLDLVKSILSEYRIHNADVRIKGDCSDDKPRRAHGNAQSEPPALGKASDIDTLQIRQLAFMAKPMASPPARKLALSMSWFMSAPLSGAVAASARASSYVSRSGANSLVDEPGVSETATSPTVPMKE